MAIKISLLSGKIEASRNWKNRCFDVSTVADYGRLVHIHAACLSLLALAHLARTGEASPARPTWRAWALAALFVSGWSLTHISATVPGVLGRSLAGRAALVWMPDLRP